MMTVGIKGWWVREIFRMYNPQGLVVTLNYHSVRDTQLPVAYLVRISGEKLGLKL